MLTLFTNEKRFHVEVLPEESRREAAVIEGVEDYAVSLLAYAVSFLNATVLLEPYDRLRPLPCHVQQIRSFPSCPLGPTYPSG